MRFVGAVCCSRDTTLKVWSVCEGTELHSLGGHTGSVTSVLILPLTESNRIGEFLSLSVTRHVSVTRVQFGYQFIITIHSTSKTVDCNLSTVYSFLYLEKYFVQTDGQTETVHGYF